MKTWILKSIIKLLAVTVVFAAALFSTETAWGQATDRYTKMANQLMELINAGDYAGIQAKFNKAMDAALPLDKSSAFFKGLTQQLGKIQRLGNPQSIGGWMVFPATFEKGAFDMRIVLDGNDQIAGLLFKPQSAAKTEPGSSQADRYTKVVNQLKELINAGDYAGIQAKFNKAMGEALPLDKSTEFFTGLTQQVGKIQKFGKPQPVGEGMIILTECEKGTLDMQIVLDGSGQIGALAFTPHVVQ